MTLDEAIFDLLLRQADYGQVVGLWPARDDTGSARYRCYLAKFGLLSTSRLLFNDTVRYPNERDLECLRAAPAGRGQRPRARAIRP